MSADMPKMPGAVMLHYDAEGHRLYTAEDLEKAKQEAARQAMEQAAKVCDSMVKANFDYSAKGAARDCASAIRALLPHDTEKRHG